jgi:chorismate mutase
MKSENPGPLDNQAIVRLFERVIDESRRLERIMTSE